MIPAKKLADESGIALVELLISLVVVAIMSTMVVGSIVGMSQVNEHVITTTDTVNDANRAETMFRDDISSASELILDVTAGAPGFTTVTTDLAGGACSTSVWKFAPAANATVLRDLTVGIQVSSSTAKRADGSLQCAGEVISRESIVLTSRAFNPVITYFNLGGRVGTVSGNAPVLSALGAGTKPATVSAESWASNKIGAVQISMDLVGVADHDRSTVRNVSVFESLESLSAPKDFLVTDFVVFGRTTLS